MTLVTTTHHAYGCFNGSITEEEFIIGQEDRQSRVELQLQKLYGFELLLIEPSRSAGSHHFFWLPEDWEFRLFSCPVQGFKSDFH